MSEDLIRKVNALERRLSDLERKEYAPVYSTWTPTFTGFSADPASPICRYVLVGKMCTAFVRLPNTGTSNATTFTVSAPFTAATVANMLWGTTWWTAVDNGVTLTVPGRLWIASAGTAFLLYKDTTGAAWTNSGTKSANFTLTYEIA
jgi:hypothetical protein